MGKDNLLDKINKIKDYSMIIKKKYFSNKVRNRILLVSLVTLGSFVMGNKTCTSSFLDNKFSSEQLIYLNKIRENERLDGIHQLVEDKMLENKTKYYSEENRVKKIPLTDDEIKARMKVTGWGKNLTIAVIKGCNNHVEVNNYTGALLGPNPKLLAYLKILETHSQSSLKRKKEDVNLKYLLTLGIPRSDIDVGSNFIRFSPPVVFEQNYYDKYIKGNQEIPDTFYLEVYKPGKESGEIKCNYLQAKNNMLSTSVGEAQLLYRVMVEKFGFRGTPMDLAEKYINTYYLALHTIRGFEKTHDFEEISRYHCSGYPNGKIDKNRERTMPKAWAFVNYDRKKDKGQSIDSGKCTMIVEYQNEKRKRKL